MNTNLFFLLVAFQTIVLCEGLRSPPDQKIYKDAVDNYLCQQQLNFLANNSLGLQFLDASGRIPSGVSTGHISDMGDYYQCIGIKEHIEEMDIQGKYCMMIIPFDQDIDIPTWPDWNITLPGNITIPGLNIARPPRFENIDEDTAVDLRKYSLLTDAAKSYAGLEDDVHTRVMPTFRYATQGFSVAVCVPKVCSSQHALQLLQQNLPINITANEFYCRLANDKPLELVDYIAISIFSFFALLNVISTTYDLTHKFYLKRADSEGSSLFRSFSIYTNTRRLLTFNSSPGTLECVDGIRAISMMWVVLGHTYSFTLLGYIHNARGIVQWMTSFQSILINSAPITVDTFFMLTGLLVVYTTVGKISRVRFLKTLHLFYLNRLLRMFPLLATIVLFQASLANHISDGPFWMNVTVAAQNCRDYWWSALLHIQNYVNPLKTCVAQTWYLSVDTQLYIISPLVLFWLWGKRHTAWMALIGALLLSLVSSSIYSFMYDFSAALANFNRLNQFTDYLTKYYMHTLTRAPPFFVGMIYGYMLHVYRNSKIRISKMTSLILWLLSLLMMLFCIVSIYPVMQPDHTAQLFDNFLNAYMRAIWAVGLGWLIFACTHGNGGPINWFLSLQLWKLPARLSFAMYLLHVSGIMIVNSSWVKTHYFTSFESLYRFTSDLVITFVFSFLVCVTIDAPFSTLQKLMLGGGKKRPEKPKIEIVESTNVTHEDILKTSL